MGRRKEVLKRTGIAQPQDSLKNVSFERFFARDFRMLHMIGLPRIDVSTNDIGSWTYLGAWVFASGWLNLFFIVSCELMTVLGAWNVDLNYSIGAATTVLSGLLCCVKGWRLWFWRDEFQKLLRHLNVMWKRSILRSRIKDDIMKTAAGTYGVTQCYIVIALTLAISYASKPYMILLHYQLYGNLKNVTSFDYKVTVFPATYPWIFQTATMSKYMVIISWEQLVMIIAAFYWISADVMFAQLTTHMAIQFRVLRHDLKYLTDTDYNDDDDDDDDDDALKNEKIFITRLSTIAKRHRDLYTYCKMIEYIYSPIIFLTLLLAGTNMCFCAFHLEKEISQGNWEEVAKSLSHAIAVILQAFLYCGYADKLTQQSGLMARGAYDCQWLERRKEFKILLRLIMMRSQKVFNCTGYGFFSAKLSQMTVIFNTAASYFTLLKTITH